LDTRSKTIFRFGYPQFRLHHTPSQNFDTRISSTQKFLFGFSSAYNPNYLSTFFCFHFFWLFCQVCHWAQYFVTNYNYHNLLNWWKSAINFTNLVALGIVQWSTDNLLKKILFTWLEVYYKLKLTWLPSNLSHISLPLYKSSMQWEFYNILVWTKVFELGLGIFGSGHWLRIFLNTPDSTLHTQLIEMHNYDNLSRLWALCDYG